jgi:taurine dioxygenase
MMHHLDWRSAATQRGLHVADLSEHVGTEIAGLDLAEDLDADTTAMLRAACAERTVLLFRGQDSLTPAQYLQFSLKFGDRPDLHSQRHFCLPEHHEIFVVGNAVQDNKQAGAPRVGLNWHTDHYHLPEPGLFTFLHAIEVPKVAGDTRYANGMAALDTLPASLRERIDALQVLHSRARLFRMLFPDAPEADVEAERRKMPDVIHPLVRLHPELRRHGLYLGGEWGSTIIDLDETEAQELFETLLHHMIDDRFSYQHAWTKGDVLMSDNRCSMHRASEWDQGSERRRLHRIILIDNVAPVH